MGYFNALHGWPSFDAITESAKFNGVIPAGRVVTKDSNGKFEAVGAAAPAGRVPYLCITDSTDLDVASVDGDAALYAGSFMASGAAGNTGGNLPTLSLAQTLEFETDQFTGVIAQDAALTFYGVAAGDTNAAHYGKFRTAAVGEPIVGRCPKASAALKELAQVSVIRVIASAYGAKA
jgi:hypothetical protein